MSISGEVSSWFRGVREIKTKQISVISMSFLRAVHGILHRKSVRDSTHEFLTYQRSNNWDSYQMLPIKGTTQAYLFSFLSTVVSQALYSFPQRQWNKRSYSIPVSGLLFAFLRERLSFMDSTNFLVEWLWKVQSNSGSVGAASTCKRRQTWSETQATLWLLIEHMILLTCGKTRSRFRLNV